MKKKNFKKVLALVLSIAMLLQIAVISVPMTASAETTYLSEMTVDFANANPVNNWQHYFIPDTTLGSDMFWDYGVRAWAASETGASRTNQGEYRDASGNLVACSAIADSVHDISLLTYVGKTYTNFELETSWVCNAAGNGQMIIGFGKNDLSKFANHANGGFVLMFDKDANVKMQSSTGMTDAVAAPASAAYGNTVNLKLVVNDATAEVTINGEYVNTFLLPEVYSGLVSIGASRSAGSAFTAYAIKETADNAGSMRADMTQSIITDSGEWTAYNAKDVLESSTIYPSMYAASRGWSYNGIVNRIKDDTAWDGRSSYSLEDIYNATYNVGVFSYNGRTYKDFIADIEYEMPSFTDNGAYMLLGFGRDNPLVYATGKDGGFALEIATSGNVALRSVDGVTALTNNAPSASAKEKRVNLRLIVKDGVATVFSSGVLLASYDLPDDYDGIFSFGATRAHYSRFYKVAVTPLNDDDAASRERYVADFNGIFSNTDWTSCWVKDADADSNLVNYPASNAWGQGSVLRRFDNHKDQNGNAISDVRRSTYDVAQFTYNAQKYQNCVINFSYTFSQHSFWGSHILLSFGRRDINKYSTHEDGGLVLEIGNITDMKLRSADGAVSGNAWYEERRNAEMKVSIIINDWKATVICDNMTYGTFDLPNDYDGYISLGATGAHYSTFNSFSVLPLDNDVLGDMTGDDEINILDLIKLKNATLDESVTTHSPADLDEDGNVASTDLVLLKKFLFGTIEKF